MLQDRLYRITERAKGEEEASFWIALDPEDPVFQGHFPGQPVLPGACMMEIGRELLGEIEGNAFDLIKAKNMKMPVVVDPRQNPSLHFKIARKDEEEGVRVKYSASDEAGTVFFKFSGLFRPQKS